MLKRSISVLLAMVCLFVFAGSALAATVPTQPVAVGVSSSIDAKVVVVNNKVALQLQGYAPYYVKGIDTAPLVKYAGRFMNAKGVLSVDAAGTFTYTVSTYTWLSTVNVTGLVTYYTDSLVAFTVGKTTYAISGIYTAALKAYSGKAIAAIGVVGGMGGNGKIYFNLLEYSAVDTVNGIGKLTYINDQMTQLTLNQTTYALTGAFNAELKAYSGQYINVIGVLGGIGGQGRQDFNLLSYSLANTTSGIGTVTYYNDQMTQITINNITYAVTGPLTSQLKQYNGKKIKVTGVLGGIGGQGRQDFYLLEYSL